MKQAAEYLYIEERHEKNTLRMDKEIKELHKKHEKELVESVKADVERQSNERIASLEDEIDDSISLLVEKFEKETVFEQETSDRLTIDDVILRRKIASTRNTIDGFNDRVAALLHSEKETQQEVRQREAECETLDALRKAKDAEFASKKSAVTRLTGINR